VCSQLKGNLFCEKGEHRIQRRDARKEKGSGGEEEGRGVDHDLVGGWVGLLVGERLASHLEWQQEDACRRRKIQTKKKKEKTYELQGQEKKRSGVSAQVKPVT